MAGGVLERRIAHKISRYRTVGVPKTSEEKNIGNQGDIEGDRASFSNDYGLILIELCL